MKQKGNKKRGYTKKDFIIDLKYIGTPTLMLVVSWFMYIIIYYIVK